ncbi:MAG: hypothetical protein IT337_18230 [Thermomicrobiales bacterium]|nr:hypothetical protein [Thermomicrobiales bacterium]
MNRFEESDLTPDTIATFLQEAVTDLGDESPELRERAAAAVDGLHRAERGLAWLAGALLDGAAAEPVQIADGLRYIVDQLVDGVALDDELAAALDERTGAVDCRACGPVAPAVRWQTASNGARHLRADCPRCGRWVKFLAQTPAWTRLADEGAA